MSILKVNLDYFYVNTMMWETNLFIVVTAGLHVLFSGSVDEFAASNSAYQILLPAFVTALKALQKPYPYPPDPQVYEGVYKLASLATVKVFTYDNQLLLETTSAVTNTAYLSYVQDLLFQVWLCICVFSS